MRTTVKISHELHQVLLCLGFQANPYWMVTVAFYE
jgi:hypothetical protein